MLPFDAPNPYGSYFSFDQVAGLAGATPNFSPGIPPAVMAAMGAGSGGFNPTQSEFTRQRAQQRYNEDFMSFVLKSDDRANVFRAMAMRQLTGGDLKKQGQIHQLFGGEDKFAEVFSYAMNRPELSNYVGGSIRSLGVGSLAITSSGMVMNGRGLTGEGVFQTSAAQGVFHHIKRQFYHPSGGANLSATQGLSMDQIGGIMTLASEQGAFSGLNIANMVTDARTGSQSMNFNPQALNRISETVKSAAKSLGQIIDIYGDGSVGELMQKATKITGVNFSRPEHMDLMRQRLGNLRTYSEMSGVNIQTVMDMAATGTRNLQAFGFSPLSAGAISEASTRNALLAFNTQRANSGVYYTNGPTLQQLNVSAQRDLVGMANDPVGARRGAIEMMIQTGMIKGGDVTKFRDMAASMGPGSYGGLDSAVAQRYGIGMDSFIRNMGGPQAILGQLRPDAVDRVSLGNTADMRRRQSVLMRQQSARHMLGMGFDDEDVSAMNRINTGLRASTAKQLMEGLDAGMSDSALQALLSGDEVGRTDVAGFTRDARRLQRRGQGRLSGLAHLLAVNRQTDPLTQNFQSQADYTETVNRQARAAALQASDVDRIRRGGSFVQGFLERLDAKDPASRFAIINATYGSKAIAGLDGGLLMDPAAYRNADGSINNEKLAVLAQSMHEQFRGLDANFMSRTFGITGQHFGKDAQGRTLRPNSDSLRRLMLTLENPELRAAAFGGFQSAMVRRADGQMATMFASKAVYDYMGESGGYGAAAAGAADRMLAKDPNDVNALFLKSLGASLKHKQMLGFRSDGAGNLGFVQGGALSDDDVRSVQGKLDNFFGTYHRIEGMSSDQMVALAKSNRDWGKSMLGALGGRATSLQMSIDKEGGNANATDVKKLSELQEKIQALKQAGITPDPSTKYSLTGELKLDGGALKLVGGLIGTDSEQGTMQSAMQRRPGL